MFTPHRNGWIPSWKAAAVSDGTKWNGKTVAADEGTWPPPPAALLVGGGEGAGYSGNADNWRSFRKAGFLDEANLQRRDWEAYLAKISELENETKLLRQNCRWEAPPMGMVKLNTDAGRTTSGQTTLGGVFRDSTGCWMRGFYQRLPQMSTMEAELRSIYLGLSLIPQLGIDHLIIESDSLAAVTFLTQPQANTHPLLLIRNVCLQRLSALSTWSIQHVFRECNTVAHLLAKLAAAAGPQLHICCSAPPSITV